MGCKNDYVGRQSKSIIFRGITDITIKFVETNVTAEICRRTEVWRQVCDDIAAMSRRPVFVWPCGFRLCWLESEPSCGKRRPKPHSQKMSHRSIYRIKTAYYDSAKLPSFYELIRVTVVLRRFTERPAFKFLPGYFEIAPCPLGNQHHLVDKNQTSQKQDYQRISLPINVPIGTVLLRC